MPRNGNGNYTLPQAPFSPGTVISSTAVNSDLSDIADALTGSLSADGQTHITGQLQAFAGTSSAPPYSFNADLMSGMFLDATGILGLSGGGTGVLIDSKGSVAIAAGISSGGVNYAVGDTITLTGGTALRSIVLTVASLTGSAIASATVTDGGLYSTQPSNPVSQGSTSGSGSGATFSITWGTASLLSDLAGTYLWDELGATPYMAVAMSVRNGLGLANYIGASNLAAAISTSIPLPIPQGRLTPSSGLPVLGNSGVTSSTLYFTPFNGLWTPIHNGSTLVPQQLAGELSLTLTSSQSASGIYDIFLAYNNGSPVIGTGPSWSAGTGGSVTAGSCARGTGVGGTALTRLLGWYVNAASMSLIWNTGAGNNTITVPANQGFYLGSIFIDSTPGQITCNVIYGQSRKWAVSNAFNGKPVILLAGDNTASWTYNSVIRPSNNSTANSLTVFSGLAEEAFELTFHQAVRAAGTGAQTANVQLGIGWNSTTSFGNTTIGQEQSAVVNGSAAYVDHLAQLDQPPALGISVATALEFSNSTTVTPQFFGTQANMLLRAEWMA